jgi:hypothetical protein
LLGRVKFSDSNLNKPKSRQPRTVLKDMPGCPSQRAQRISTHYAVAIIARSATFSARLAEKLGQPVPELNFAAEQTAGVRNRRV